VSTRPPGDRARPQRPATLRAALALTALTGLANLLVGGAVLALVFVGVLPNRPGVSSQSLVAVGVTYLLLGALTVAGAYGLLTRKAGSRVFVTIVMMLRIAVASITFGVLGTWYAAGSAVGIVLALVVVALLWDSRANAYYHEHP
jgi:hypothetical protein